MTISIASNARSNSYRFTTTDANHPLIQQLREQVKASNKNIISQWHKSTETLERFGVEDTRKVRTTHFIRIRPRGPRNGAIHDTRFENATHFDVYVSERRSLKGYDFK